MLEEDVVLAWWPDGVGLGIASEIMDTDAWADRFLLSLTRVEVEGPNYHEWSLPVGSSRPGLDSSE